MEKITKEELLEKLKLSDEDLEKVNGGISYSCIEQCEIYEKAIDNCDFAAEPDMRKECRDVAINTYYYCLYGCAG